MPPKKLSSQKDYPNESSPRGKIFSPHPENPTPPPPAESNLLFAKSAMKKIVFWRFFLSVNWLKHQSS